MKSIDENRVYHLLCKTAQSDIVLLLHATVLVFLMVVVVVVVVEVVASTVILCTKLINWQSHQQSASWCHFCSWYDVTIERTERGQINSSNWMRFIFDQGHVNQVHDSYWNDTERKRKGFNTASSVQQRKKNCLTQQKGQLHSEHDSDKITRAACDIETQFSFII